jgi:hypothetical protein
LLEGLVSGPTALVPKRLARDASLSDSRLDSSDLFLRSHSARTVEKGKGGMKSVYKESEEDSKRSGELVQWISHLTADLSELT